MEEAKYVLAFDIGQGRTARAHGYTKEDALKAAQEMYENGNNHTAVEDENGEVIKEWCW